MTRKQLANRTRKAMEIVDKIEALKAQLEDLSWHFGEDRSPKAINDDEGSLIQAMEDYLRYVIHDNVSINMTTQAKNGIIAFK